MTQILVVHHSMMGHTTVAAERLVEGVRSVSGVACISKPVLAEGVDASQAAKREDFRGADALILGCPVHQRNVSWEMKRFIDLHCEPGWFWDDMVGRVGGVFATGGGHGGAGGGAELAQLGLLSNLASMGMILVSLPKTTPGFDVAGMHWGPQVRTGGPKMEPDAPDHMDAQALETLFHYGATVARVTTALKRGAEGQPLIAVGNMSPSAKARAGRTKQDGTTALGEPR